MKTLSRGQRLLVELRMSGLKAARPSFPEFYGHVPPSPCTNLFGPTPVKQLPDDAKQFPVGHSHKQGNQLLTPDDVKNNLQWFGGKKS